MQPFKLTLFSQHNQSQWIQNQMLKQLHAELLKVVFMQIWFPFTLSNITRHSLFDSTETCTCFSLGLILVEAKRNQDKTWALFLFTQKSFWNRTNYLFTIRFFAPSWNKHSFTHVKLIHVISTRKTNWPDKICNTKSYINAMHTVYLQIT